MNKLTLNHLYSQSLNIYGDLGNILALQHHAKLLDIDLQVVHTEIGDEIIPSDIYFAGGGQDQDQLLVFEDLLKHKSFLAEEIENNKIFLTVCGGYQLFGKYFLDSQNRMIEGLGILDFETRASDDKVSSRCIGNIVVEMGSQFVTHWNIDTSFSKYLVGFENHGGQTYLNAKGKMQKAKLSTIGKVVRGFGNNAVEKTEGCWYKNFIGCYMHGSLLPKNPHLAVSLLDEALSNRHSGLDPESIRIDSIRQLANRWNDKKWSLEKQAHEAVLKMN